MPVSRGPASDLATHEGKLASDLFDKGPQPLHHGIEWRQAAFDGYGAKPEDRRITAIYLDTPRFRW